MRGWLHYCILIKLFRFYNVSRHCRILPIPFHIKLPSTMCTKIKWTGRLRAFHTDRSCDHFDINSLHTSTHPIHALQARDKQSTAQIICRPSRPKHTTSHPRSALPISLPIHVRSVQCARIQARNGISFPISTPHIAVSISPLPLAPHCTDVLPTGPRPQHTPPSQSPSQTHSAIERAIVGAPVDGLDVHHLAFVEQARPGPRA